MSIPCLELFAGAGGAGLGLRRAGFGPITHVEKNLAAVTTLRRNHQHESGRALQLDVEDTDSVLYYAKGIPALWASPPCPLHSRPNSRNRHKAYDGWPATLAIIDLLKPDLVMLENVGGAYGAMLEWASALVQRGYLTTIGLENASWYGVPQQRSRCFIVASKHALPGLPSDAFSTAPAAMTLGDALPYLRTERAEYSEADAKGHRRSATTGEILYPLGCGPAGTEPWRLDTVAPTVMTTEVKGTRASASNDWLFNGGPDRLSDALFLATGRRRATVRECAIIQGFPLDYEFFGTVEEQYTQVGNAVPPALAEAVARAGLASLGGR